MNAVPVTQRDLLDMFCVATAVNAAYRIFAAARIRRVEMWGPAAASSFATVSISLPGSVYVGGESKTISDSTLGPDRPAHICVQPPVGSLAYNWMNDGAADVVMNISCPLNTIIDVDIEYVMRNSEVQVAVTGAVAGATVGRVYSRTLNSGGLANFIPVALIYI